MSVRILLLDIELAPHLVWVWKFFKENVGAKQVVENGYMLSWAAKWLEEDEVFYQDLSNQHEKEMLIPLAALLDEADIVVTHNGIKFDIPHIQGRFLVHDIRPPAPFKQVDTLLIARKEFNFPSNSLEYLCTVLNLKAKKDGHQAYPGFLLWKGVLKDDPKAWEEMKVYNIDDILALEELYLRFRPFSRYHPNVAVFEDEGACSCPRCNSSDIQYRGYAHTMVARYRRFVCNACGAWSRSRIAEKDRPKVLVNAIN